MFAHDRNSNLRGEVMQRVYFKNKVLLLLLYLFNCCMLILVTNLIEKLDIYYGDKGIYSWKTTEINVQSESVGVLEPFKSIKMVGKYYVYKNNYEEYFDIKGVFLSDSEIFDLASGGFQNIYKWNSNEKWLS